MSLSKIVLQLARNPGLPNGDAGQGYTIVAPLDASGQIDLDAWRTHRDACHVVRFSPDPDEHATGKITHRGSRWFFHYDEDHEGPDEPVYKLGDHTLRHGDYVTIHEADGDDLVHKITEATEVHA